MSEIKTPVSWLKDRGVKISLGDVWFNEAGNCGSDVRVELLSNINSGALDYLFITSFAYRESTGYQPVADWVPIDVRYKTGITDTNALSCNFTWGRPESYCIESWKPNTEALYKIYLAEQQAGKVEKGCLCDLTKNGSVKLKGDCTIKVCDGCKGKINDLPGGETVFKDDRDIEFTVTGHSYDVDNEKDKSKSNNNKESVLFEENHTSSERLSLIKFVNKNNLRLDGESTIDCAIRELSEKHGITGKPIYTKEMHEGRRLPPVGAIVLYVENNGFKDSDCFKTWRDGDELEVVAWGKSGDSTVNDIAIVRHRCGLTISLNSSAYKPVKIESQEDKAVRDITHLVMDKQATPRGIIKAIIDSEITGVKWVGE